MCCDSEGHSVDGVMKFVLQPGEPSLSSQQLYLDLGSRPYIKLLTHKFLSHLLGSIDFVGKRVDSSSHSAQSAPHPTNRLSRRPTDRVSTGLNGRTSGTLFQNMVIDSP